MSVRHRTDIQGLRAVSVILVAMVHGAVPWFGGGFVGVDAFLVLSGFLITSMLINERESTGSISLSNFYSRRIRRILPAAGFVALVTLAASWWLLNPYRARLVATDAIATATFATNLTIPGRGDDFVHPGFFITPLSHFWSLAVEEQFYLVWPLLVLLACRRAAAGESVKVRVGAIAALVSIASFSACVAAMDPVRNVAYFWGHTRAFELSLGALAATLPMPRSARDRFVSSCGAWAGLAVLIGSATVLRIGPSFPAPLALVPVTATVLMLRGGEARRWAPTSILSAPPLQWLGARSYSFYLWHWPFMLLGPLAVGRDNSMWNRLVWLIAVAIASDLTYRLVENPIRHRTSIVGARAFLLAAGIAVTLVTAGLLALNRIPPAAVSMPMLPGAWH